MHTLASTDFITINTSERNGCYIIDVSGELIGNAAEGLISLINNVFLKAKTLRLILDLRKVTYITSYSFGIIAHFWMVVKENGRIFNILADSVIHAKFDKFVSARCLYQDAGVADQ
ncbi:MAG: hypothetical protein A2293_03510 [Elusimicrobia bacterium RIFOXYB2_FULL_49_7]|nr:MAG: hypothetical protein A2293_03510 [Elusimicrobia bacterium RIFOXYB2_FULL_49_7]